VDAFAQCLEYALFEEGADWRAAARGAQLRHRTLLHYRWDMMAEEIERIYTALLTGAVPLAHEPRIAWGAKRDQVSSSVAQRER
jgi:hypothetical protein